MPHSAIDTLSATITLACYSLTFAGLAALLTSHVRVRIRVRKGRRQARWFVRSISVLGFSLAISTPAAAVGSRRPDPPHRRAAAAAPPWSATGGSPPRPPVGSRAHHPATVQRAHPAIHGRRLGPDEEPAPLFPRVRASRDTGTGTGSRRAGRSIDECRERRACMAAHPSSRPRIHVVRPGDSLWTIAAAALGTDDPVPVARYWARIHRANREVIGPNPDLIYPGQRLALPNPNVIAQGR